MTKQLTLRCPKDRMKAIGSARAVLGLNTRKYAASSITMAHKTLTIPEDTTVARTRLIDHERLFNEVFPGI
jgi:hypothetical protein